MRVHHRNLSYFCCFYAVAAAAVLSPGTSAAAAPSYTYTDLGTFGGDNSWAYDINNNGQVTGWAWKLTDGTVRDYNFKTGEWSESTGVDNASIAFVYNRGEMIPLGQDDEWSEGRSINQAGRIVGSVGRADNLKRAFRLGYGPLDETADEGFFHPHIQASTAWDINDRNQIVGNTYAPEGYAAFVYERNEMRNLRPMLGAASHTRAINNNGLVVGDSYLSAPRTGQIHAYSHDLQSGVTTDLGTLAASNSGDSHAWDVNEQGQIVGSSAEHAFLYDEGEMIDLGVLPGTTRSDAFSINELGHVVGRSGHKAFIHDGTQMYDSTPWLRCRRAGRWRTRGPSTTWDRSSVSRATRTTTSTRFC